MNDISTLFSLGGFVLASLAVSSPLTRGCWNRSLGPFRDQLRLDMQQVIQQSTVSERCRNTERKGVLATAGVSELLDVQPGCESES